MLSLHLSPAFLPVLSRHRHLVNVAVSRIQLMLTTPVTRTTKEATDFGLAGRRWL